MVAGPCGPGNAEKARRTGTPGGARARTPGVPGPPDVESGNRRGAGSGPEAPPAHSHVNPARPIRMPTRPKERASAPTHRIAKVANVQRALRREGERPRPPITTRQATTANPVTRSALIHPRDGGARLAPEPEGPTGSTRLRAKVDLAAGDVPWTPTSRRQTGRRGGASRSPSHPEWARRRSLRAGPGAGTGDDYQEPPTARACGDGRGPAAAVDSSPRKGDTSPRPARRGYLPAGADCGPGRI